MTINKTNDEKIINEIMKKEVLGLNKNFDKNALIFSYNDLLLEILPKVIQKAREETLKEVFKELEEECGLGIKSFGYDYEDFKRRKLKEGGKE